MMLSTCVTLLPAVRGVLMALLRLTSPHSLSAARRSPTACPITVGATHPSDLRDTCLPELRARAALG